jgi:DNA primase
MAKISQISAKYIVHSKIEIEGIVDRPDVIGAIFGQTEGLLGPDLELRELQRSGRIGRIEVEMNAKSGKTYGTIIIPSSLDKAETSIIGASLEIIQRIGPCNAKIKVESIEDIRISKREFVISRAKELLKTLINVTSPDSQELSDEVANSVRVMEITEYGMDKLPAGPNIDDSDEIIIVEGRADVINLLKHGFKNVISTNGTTVVSQTVIELAKRKTTTVFTDGDRGGDLIIKALLSVAEIDFITKAPDGKEVEEITKKEIHKCLRSKIAAEQVKLEIETPNPKGRIQESSYKKASKVQASNANQMLQKRPVPLGQPRLGPRPPIRYNNEPRKKEEVNSSDKAAFKKLLEDLVGTNGAYILNEKKEILGKVPITELASTIKSLGSGIYAIILDGTIDSNFVSIAEKAEVMSIVGMESKIKPETTKINILTVDDF